MTRGLANLLLVPPGIIIFRRRTPVIWNSENTSLSWIPCSPLFVFCGKGIVQQAFCSVSSPGLGKNRGDWIHKETSIHGVSAKRQILNPQQWIIHWSAWNLSTCSSPTNCFSNVQCCNYVGILMLQTCLYVKPTLNGRWTGWFVSMKIENMFIMGNVCLKSVVWEHNASPSTREADEGFFFWPSILCILLWK